MSLELEGYENFDKILAKFEGNKITKAAMQKACMIVEEDARKRTHAFRDTGELSRSITSRVEINGSEIQGIVYTPLFYAPFVEYGTGIFAENGNGRKDVPWRYKDIKGNWWTTSGQEPKPFLRLALYENRNKILQTFKEGINND